MDEVIRLLESIRPRRLALAPLFPRGAAHLIDSSAALFAAIVVALVLTGVGVLIERSPIPVPGWVGHVVGPTIQALVSTAGAVAVILLPELWHQTSIGKYLFDLRVARADGTRPGLVCIVTRLLLRYPFLALFPLLFVESIGTPALVVAAFLQVAASLTAVVCYFVRGGLTLSDLVTRTRVAYRRRGA
jgi:uncharacterized RDD family membrane protein YckC